jgi:hypothetical protein
MLLWLAPLQEWLSWMKVFYVVVRQRWVGALKYKLPTIKSRPPNENICSQDSMKVDTE